MVSNTQSYRSTDGEIEKLAYKEKVLEKVEGRTVKLISSEDYQEDRT